MTSQDMLMEHLYVTKKEHINECESKEIEIDWKLILNLKNLIKKVT